MSFHPAGAALTRGRGAGSRRQVPVARLGAGGQAGPPRLHQWLLGVGVSSQGLEALHCSVFLGKCK